MDINPKVKKAVRNLVFREFFLGAMALGMPVSRKDEIKTMATDGANMYYCDEFVNKLTQAEVTGVTAHEVLHKFFKHHLRKGHRDHMLWNIACDLAINPLLKDMGFTLPNDALHIEEYKGMSAEEIFDKMQKDGRVKKISVCAWGGVEEPKNEDGSAKSKAELDAVGREDDIQIQGAYASAKAQGHVPQFVEQWMTEFRDPKLDYKERLPFYVSGGRAPSDYTMKRFNRKMYGLHGMILPTLQDIHAGTVAIFIDTSGSVSDEELKQFLGEVDACHKQCRPEELIVVQCDADVSQVDRFYPEDDIVAVKVKGRGGTSFIPPFKWLEREGIEPDTVIYLTDLCCDSFPNEPSYPVLWVSTRKGTAPFGEIVYIDVNE